MRILYKFTTRSRPAKMFACIDNILSMSGSEDFIILLTLDVDDFTVANRSVWDRIKSYGYKVVPVYGFSRNKINAINRDVNLAGRFDILFNMSDDMVIVKPGFDLQIIKDMTNDFPDTDGVLHYHDGHHYGDKLMTLSIIGAKYYERDGYIYHPDFKSVYADNEARDVAMIRNKYKYYGDGNILFNHVHPLHSKGVPMDDQYRHTESFYKEDQKTYFFRKANNFFL